MVGCRQSPETGYVASRHHDWYAMVEERVEGGLLRRVVPVRDTPEANPRIRRRSPCDNPLVTHEHDHHAPFVGEPRRCSTKVPLEPTLISRNLGVRVWRE